MINQTIDYFDSSIESYQTELMIEDVPIEPKYKIINIVALGTLRFKEDIKLDFSQYLNQFEFRQLNRFPGILFKVENISIILFRNGKMILTGIKEISDIPHIKERIENFVRKIGIQFTEFSIVIQNFVSMTNLNRVINLEAVCLSLENCIYEPEQFPAAIIKPSTGGTFLLFSNSKIIGLGMRDTSMLDRSINYLLKDLNENEVFFN